MPTGGNDAAGGHSRSDGKKKPQDKPDPLYGARFSEQPSPRVVFASALAFSLLSIAGASLAEPTDATSLPVAYKALITDAIVKRFPTGQIASVASTTDLEEMIEACGQVWNGDRLIPFWVGVFPGQPPSVLPLVAGVNEGLSTQVRSICARAGLDLAQ